jgi:capsular polysaccharide biosynthesis protein
VGKLLVWWEKALLVALALAFVAVLWSELQTSTYEATAEVRAGSQKAVPAVMDTIEGRPVADEVIRRLGLEMPPGVLLGNLTVEQVGTSRFVRLGYTDTKPERARRVVNAVGRVSSERVPDAALHEKASLPDAPVATNDARNGLVAFAVGLLVSVALLKGRGPSRGSQPSSLYSPTS